MLIYAINFQGDAAARLVMTVPPLAQSVITLVGMFWIVLHIDRALALLSLIGRPVPVLLGRLLRDAHPGAAAAGAGDGGRVALDHPRGDLDAARDRRLRPRGPRAPPLPRAGHSGPSTRGSRSRSGRRCSRWPSTRSPPPARRWCSASAPTTCCKGGLTVGRTAGRDGLHRRRLQAAGDDQHDARLAAGRVRAR